MRILLFVLGMLIVATTTIGQEDNTLLGADRGGLVGAWMQPGTCSPKQIVFGKDSGSFNNTQAYFLDASGFGNTGYATNWPGNVRSLGVVKGPGSGVFAWFNHDWDNHILCGNNPAVDIRKGGLTILAWVWIGSASTRTIVGKVESGRHQYDMLHVDSWGKFRFLVGADSNYKSHRFGTPAYSTWTMLVGTWNQKAGLVRTYQDGVEVAWSTPEGSFNPTNSLGNGGPLYIGKRSDGYQWNGKIGIVLIYNRDISYQEVRAIYAATKGLYQ